MTAPATDAHAGGGRRGRVHRLAAARLATGDRIVEQQRTVIVPADFANLTGMVAGLKTLVEENVVNGGGGGDATSGGNRKPAPWGKE